MSTASRLLHGTDEPPLAGCPGCKAPLIATMIYPGYEFICLECGRRCAFLSPVRLEPHAENLEWHARLQAEWDERQDALIIPRSWKSGCPKCQPMVDANYHHAHATEKEWVADAAAREWIASRAKRKAASS